ncbi:hypothetical protein ARSEF1564_000003 [Beauveria bassiana]
MDPSKKPDVQPHMHTRYPSEEEGTSYGQLRGLYAVVDRDRRPIQVSPPCIHDWADLNVSSDDSTSNSDVSELDLNHVLEEQSIAPTAQDASDWGIPPNQTQGKATPSVADTSDLDSEWKSLSAEIWETVHTSRSDNPDPNDALQAQPTAATARLASNQDSPSDRTRATTTSSLISDIADLTDALKSTVNTAHAEPDFAYSILGNGNHFCFQAFISSTSKLGSGNYFCPNPASCSCSDKSDSFSHEIANSYAEHLASFFLFKRLFDRAMDNSY